MPQHLKKLNKSMIIKMTEKLSKKERKTDADYYHYVVFLRFIIRNLDVPIPKDKSKSGNDKNGKDGQGSHNGGNSSKSSRSIKDSKTD